MNQSPDTSPDLPVSEEEVLSFEQRHELGVDQVADAASSIASIFVESDELAPEEVLDAANRVLSEAGLAVVSTEKPKLTDAQRRALAKKVGKRMAQAKFIARRRAL